MMNCEGSGRNHLYPVLKYCSRTCLEGLRWNCKNQSQDARPQVQDLNMRPLEYKVRMLIILFWDSVLSQSVIFLLSLFSST